MKYERVYPNIAQTNLVAKFLRNAMEGELCKELVSDEVICREMVRKILGSIKMSGGLCIKCI